MTELLKNAWLGWLRFNEPGKVAALLLISLLFMWIYYRRIEQKTFFVYTAVTTGCCIFPVTAAVLMCYQTKFYDYQWIWSTVPMTAAVAFALVVFLTDVLREEAKGSRSRETAAVFFLLAALALCSGMGKQPWDSMEQQIREQQAENLLAKVQEKSNQEQLYMWAPREIMTCARAYDSSIKLLYGRNMWDASLNAYAYDVYSEDIVGLYLWMSGEAAEESRMTAQSCAETVASTAVNCILLPENTEREILECFEKILGVKAEQLEGYYLLLR